MKMSKNDKIEDILEHIIELLFNDNVDNDVFGEEMDLHPEMQKITENILRCQHYLQEFSDDKKFRKAFFDLDDFQGEELAIREQVFYRRGVKDGMRIFKMLIEL
jgi:hypothetical protein